MHHPQLFNRLLQYELADNNISQSATQAFSRHLWYLTAELVPLELFSSWVHISECQAVAEALLEVQATSELQSPQNRFGSGRANHSFHLWSTCHHGCVTLLGWTSGSLCPVCRSAACDWVGHQGGTHFQCAYCIMLQQWM